jgi:hypothetical protein
MASSSCQGPLNAFAVRGQISSAGQSPSYLTAAPPKCSLEVRLPGSIGILGWGYERPGPRNIGGLPLRFHARMKARPISTSQASRTSASDHFSLAVMPSCRIGYRHHDALEYPARTVATFQRRTRQDLRRRPCASNREACEPCQPLPIWSIGRCPRSSSFLTHSASAMPASVDSSSASTHSRGIRVGKGVRPCWADRTSSVMVRARLPGCTKPDQAAWIGCIAVITAIELVE